MKRYRIQAITSSSTGTTTPGYGDAIQKSTKAVRPLSDERYLAGPTKG